MSWAAFGLGCAGARPGWPTKEDLINAWQKEGLRRWLTKRGEGSWDCRLASGKIELPSWRTEIVAAHRNSQGEWALQGDLRRLGNLLWTAG
jgi:hypothetical protein